MSAKPTTALFVRIPQAQARALDRLAFESRRPKQAVVSDLLSRYIGEPAGRRVAPDPLQEPDTVIGHYAFRPDEPDVLTRERGGLTRERGGRAPEPDVLTLDEVADLLRVEPREVEQLVRDGALPGRRIGSAWRFSRAAVLDWLARGSPLEHGEE